VTEQAPVTSLDAFVPLAEAYLLVAKLGHLSVSDVQRLETRLEAEAAEWPAPLLRVEGVDLDASAETGAVQARLGGDVDALRDVVRGVQDVTARTQIFVDRRTFRPLLEVGRVTDAASEDYAAALLSTLEGFTGGWWWQSHLTLLAPGATASDGYRVEGQVALRPRSGPG
jgi:hypothetical protein